MGKYIGAFLSVVASALLVVVVINILGATGTTATPLTASASADTVSTSQGVLKRASISLDTLPAGAYTDPDFVQQYKAAHPDVKIPPEGNNEDWVTYWPTTDLVVPAHALVTVTIENYDSMTQLLNPFYATAQGTVGADGTGTDVMTVDGKVVNGMDPAEASHTFTLRSNPGTNQSWLYVSVPVEGVPDDAAMDSYGFPKQPAVTQFSFITGDPGTYVWNCFDPCGNQYDNFGGAMQTRGYMSGTLTVVG